MSLEGGLNPELLLEGSHGSWASSCTERCVSSSCGQHPSEFYVETLKSAHGSGCTA